MWTVLAVFIVLISGVPQGKYEMVSPDTFLSLDKCNAYLNQESVRQSFTDEVERLKQKYQSQTTEKVVIQGLGPECINISLDNGDDEEL